MITHVGVGARANQDFQTAGQPEIPAGVAAGDLLLCLSIARSTADNVLSSSWATLSVVDTAGFYIRSSYRIAAGSDAAPTITPANMTSGQTHVSRVTAWRGVDPVAPFGPFSSPAQASSAANVVLAATPAYAPDNGAVVVMGVRQTTWTSVAALTGDGLSWIEAWDESTSITNTMAWAMDYAIWSGGAPTLTPKTFTVTGGSAGISVGQMWTLNASGPPASGQRRNLLSSMTFPPFP